MGYHYILSEHKDDVAYITINRPEKLNALNKLTIQELSDAIKKADRDTKVKCIILTGSGPKAFVAGADIKEFSHFNKKQAAKMASDGQRILFNLLDNLFKHKVPYCNFHGY